MTSMTGGEALAKQLSAIGVRHVFGVPGVQLDWAVDGLAQLGGEIAFVVPRHEQAATYMADGYARTTGRVGVAMVVPGPGVLNAGAGLATAYACSSRVLFLAGQIPSPFIGRGLGMLHEIRDQSAVIDAVTKARLLCRSPDEIASSIRAAFDDLHTGTPRPVAVEVPPDVLSASTARSIEAWTRPPVPAPDESQVAAAARLLAGARFPVIVAGGGVLASGGTEELRLLAERLQAPVVMSENGNGALDARHSLALSALAGRALFPHADVVLGVGTRFIDGRGQSLVDGSKKRLILVNTERADLGKPRSPEVAIECEARTALAAIADALGGHTPRNDGTGSARKVREWCEAQIAPIEPQAGYIRTLREAIPDDGILVCDLTQVGYLANIAYPVRRPRTLITPGYQGTLGFGWATALGASVGNPDKAVVCVSGDGGFGWNLQELATAGKYNLPVVAVVFNDSAFGNVKRLQVDQFGRQLGVDLHNPDFVKLAQAFGLDGTRVSTPEALARTLRESIQARKPFVIEVKVSEMPSPWHLLRPTYAPPAPPPPNPLGEAA
jgi:acetolactate synthase-1/2/3 large subunit